MRKYWTTAASGAFETSGNWSPAGAPGVNDLAIITATLPPSPPPTPYTVTVSAGTKVLGVSLGADAILDITNSAFFRADEGTATGANLGVIEVETGSTFAFGGVLSNQNTIELAGTGAGATFF